MNCPICNKALVDNSKHCVFCGKVLFRKCPICGKTISVEDKICEFCRTNIPLYEQSLKLMEEGGELESLCQYEKARACYDGVKLPNKLVTEAEQKIKEIDEKLEKINSLRSKGEELLEGKSYAKAHKVFSELYTILPDEATESALNTTSMKLKWYFRRRWIFGILGAALIAGIIWQCYENNPSVLAVNELHSLLGSKNLDIRNSSAIVLGFRRDDVSKPVLKLLSYNQNEIKRVYSLAALTDLNDAEALKELRLLLFNGSTPARLASAWIFASRRDTTILPYIEYFIQSADVDLRVGGSVLLFNIGYSNGLQMLDSILYRTTPEVKLKGLYALYLLSDGKVLRDYSSKWIPLVAPLLRDNSDNVKLLAASLLQRYNPELTPKDSIAIAKILWDGFVSDSKGSADFVSRLPEVKAFYLVRGIITKTGDEDFTHLSPSARDIRQKCNLELSKIELGDKVALQSALSGMKSADLSERLYNTLISFKFRPWRTVFALRSLMKSDNEIIKLITCKLVLEFAYKINIKIKR